MSRVKFVEDISIGTIITVCVLGAGIITSFTWTQADVKALQHEVAELKEHNNQLLSKEMVQQMFITRDIQINQIRQDVAEAKEYAKENQRLLQEIVINTSAANN